MNLIERNSLPPAGWNQSRIHCNLIHASVCGDKAVKGDWSKLKSVTFRPLKSAGWTLDAWHLFIVILQKCILKCIPRRQSCFRNHAFI